MCACLNSFVDTQIDFLKFDAKLLYMHMISNNFEVYEGPVLQKKSQLQGVRGI